jgi:DNA processing protein
MNSARRVGAQLVCLGDPAYPDLLAHIPDAPPALWALGDIALLNRPALAVVGARNASSLGVRMARSLSRDLAAQGHVIASGLARGIDAAAHKGALEHGTIAVTAGGVDVVYPSENADLARKIAEVGLIVSEQPMGLQPRARHFPSRNRIISGMARALIVVEAAAKSGSLITARAALDQGREVLAVPGHPFDARASGCNMLIRDGAQLVRNSEDVSEALETLFPAGQQRNRGQPNTTTLVSDDVAPATRTGHQKPRPAQKDKRPSSETRHLHQTILDRLGPTPLAEDQLIRDLETGASNLTPTLTELEIEGKIIRHAGGLLSRSA